MTLRFVTTNPGKLREASDLLRRPLQGVRLELEELQIADMERLVRHKARQAYRLVRAPLIVEDTGLVFAAWGELPGPFVKHFLANLGLAGMVDALAPSENWDAVAVCGVGYHDGERVHYFEGRVKGTVGPPAGGGGFGWDPIFRPEGETRAFAEMTAAEKNGCSHRRPAMLALRAHLESPRPRITPVPAGPPARPDPRAGGRSAPE